jgi:acyl-CoA dehydrogenase
MFLLNPLKLDQSKKLVSTADDPRTFEILAKTIAFFEAKGRRRLKEDDHAHTWYADFLEFQKREKVFATLLTPSDYGFDSNCRWDTYRNCFFNEILGFYGLAYWYTWQVSILGLGPIWMSQNHELKLKAAHLLQDGEVFAFGLSERAHGADIYATEMALTPRPDGTFCANGEKYYIGNGQIAPMVSTFGRFADTNEYVFFIADFRQPGYQVLSNVTASQNFVAHFALKDYPITSADILSTRQEAWDTALNTVNVGKYNLGWASIGICTHALYEAIHHAANRRLYGMYVTDFPHVRHMFIDATARLIAMRLFTLRAADYMRSASPTDRRYLLYNPLVKMKVTTQGEEVINLLWDVIAAKGFEKDTYFEMAARDIRALPKLEGTVHVNIALIIKFMPNYFFAPAEYPPMPRRNESADDRFLFNQGPARGLGKIPFHDYQAIFEQFDLPNVNLFKDQVAAFKTLLATATPSETQQKDIDFLLALGEIFASVVYAQLILENVVIYQIEADWIDQIFDFLVRDVSRYALNLYSKPSTTQAQMEHCLRMLHKPISPTDRIERVGNMVHALSDQYTMAE